MTNDPGYVEYTRRDPNCKRVLTGGTDFLLIPSILEESPYNPFDLSDRVNTLMVCDKIDEELVNSATRTRAARAKLIAQSPRIMRTSKKREVFIKADSHSRLSYELFSESGRCNPETPFDYVATKDAAGLYVRAAGICSAAALERAIDQGMINFFLSEQESHFGDEKLRRNMQVYLLCELNGL